MSAAFAAAFLRRDPPAAQFLPTDFRDADMRAAVVRSVATRRKPVTDPVLAELTAQQARFGDSPARTAALAALSQAGTVAVVSGQQVGLFLGPLYSFYKAASAVHIAQALQAQTGVRCVPIFWLQTEDHDYEEIRRCHVPCFASEDDGGGMTLALPAQDADGTADVAVGARASVAHRRLPASVNALLDQMEEALGGLPHAGEMLPLLRAHYRPGVALGDAFAGVMAALFADEGLLVINPRTEALARAAAPIYALSIARQADVGHALSQRGAALHTAGYAQQVAVRPETTLAFFHAQVTGDRFRLERTATGDGWLVPQGAAGGDGGRILTTAELLGMQEADPLRFSSSALLRPLVQDLLLPTAAYVGGPGEINYWAQLAPLYELAAQTLPVRMPLVVPRARFRCIDDGTRSVLRKLGLAPADVEVGADVALARAQSAVAGETSWPDADGVRAALLAGMTERLSAVAALHPGLTDAVGRTRVSIERNVDKLVARYSRLRLGRDAVLVSRVARAQRFLMPAGVPQERHFSLPYFVCKYGLGALKQQLFGSLAAHDFTQPGVRDLDL